MSKPLPSGQWLQHERFGLGVTISSDDQRTTIDFDEHGRKVFVTQMLEVQLAPAPDRPRARRSRKATSTS